MRTVRTMTIAILLAFALSLGFESSADAHVLEQDGGIGAVLHISPDDDPVAGELTAIGLDFSNSDPGFNLDRYNVDVSLQGTSVTASTPPVSLQPDGSASLYGTAQVTFPSPGSYDVIVSGTPYKTTAGGKPFKLTYEVRAERPRQPGVAGVVNSAGFDTIMLGLLSFGALAIIANYQIQQGSRYKNRH